MTSSREFKIKKRWYLVIQLTSVLLKYIYSLIHAIIRYADRINAYWTGYFTSRPALKGYVRLLSGYYLVSVHLC